MLESILLLVLLGAVGFLALKLFSVYESSGTTDPLAAEVRDALRTMTGDRSEPAKPSKPSKPEPVKSGYAVREIKALTLAQAVEIRDKLSVTDPEKLVRLYAMTRPQQERASVLSFIRPQPKGSAIKKQNPQA